MPSDDSPQEMSRYRQYLQLAAISPILYPILMVARPDVAIVWGGLAVFAAAVVVYPDRVLAVLFDISSNIQETVDATTLASVFDQYWQPAVFVGLAALVFFAIGPLIIMKIGPELSEELSGEVPEDVE